MKFKTFIILFLVSLALGAIGYVIDRNLLHHTSFPIFAAILFLLPSMGMVYYSKVNGDNKK